MRSTYYLSLTGCAALVAAAFLPWLRLGAVGLPGTSDPAGFFVLGMGVFGLLLSLVGLLTSRDTRHGLVLVGLAGLTTLVAVWLSGPATVAERAQVRSQAVALVDNLPVQPVPPVRVGVGLIVGLAAAATVAAAGLAGVWSRPRA